jgi:hypothetical protein
MASRVIIAYGESGSGKSEGALALFLWKLQQWRALGLDYIMRVYVGDGSAATYLDTGLVINPPEGPRNEDGLIELCFFKVYPWPLTTVNQITEGWFPEGGVHGAPLVAPEKQANFKRVRFWAYEGLQVVGDYMMGGEKLGGLAEQASRGIKIGPEAAIRITDTLYEIDKNTGLPDPLRPIKGSGTGASFGSNGQGHYMLAQGHLSGAFERTKALEGWVFWTSHERAAKDKSGYKKDGQDKDARVYGAAPVAIGPSAVGDALTLNIQKGANELLHFQKANRLVQAKEKDKVSDKLVNQLVTEHRIYTREHLDPDLDTPLRYRALVRSSTPDTVKDFYTGTAEEGSGIVKLYEDLAKAAQAKQKRALAALGNVVKAEAPKEAA